jgi:hypothetical protein
VVVLDFDQKFPAQHSLPPMHELHWLQLQGRFERSHKPRLRSAPFFAAAPSNDRVVKLRWLRFIQEDDMDYTALIILIVVILIFVGAVWFGRGRSL